MTDSDLNQQIGASVRQARLSRGVTQDALAQLLGVDRVTVTRYENGSRPLPLAALLQIADYLEQPVGALLPVEQSMAVCNEPGQTSIQHIVRVLTERPDLIPTVLDLLDTLLEAELPASPAPELPQNAPHMGSVGAEESTPDPFPEMAPDAAQKGTQKAVGGELQDVDDGLQEPGAS
jgi:transcriptional regulator with XRE-family HTH domain